MEKTKKEALETLERVLNSLQLCTEPCSGHPDPNSIDDCWNEVADMIAILKLDDFKQGERVFTEKNMTDLQSAVHKITGDGDVMRLFNKILGINAG